MGGSLNDTTGHESAPLQNNYNEFTQDNRIPNSLHNSGNGNNFLQNNNIAPQRLNRDNYPINMASAQSEPGQGVAHLKNNYNSAQQISSSITGPKNAIATLQNNDYKSQFLSQDNKLASSINDSGHGNAYLQNNYNAPQRVNQKDNSSYINDQSLSNSVYQNSPSMAYTKTRPNVQSHQNGFTPPSNISRTSPYYEDSSISQPMNKADNQAINDSYSFNSSADIVDGASSKHFEKNHYDTTSPNQKADTIDTRPSTNESMPQSDSGSEKVEEKKSSNSNGTYIYLLIAAPASKSLVTSLWGSLSLFGKSSKDNTAETSGPIKAKLGQELSCYFDDATGKWVFPDAPQTAEAAPLPPPPQTKAPPPTQNNSAATSRQPSPAPSGTVSPAPLSSTPKPTYIGALGGSSRANRRTARSKYVDVLNPASQANDIQPSFDFSPVNNFGNAEPKIMKVYIK